MAKKKYSRLVIFYLILSFIICTLLRVFLGIEYVDLVAIYIGVFACFLALDFFYIYLEKKFDVYDGDY